MLLQSLLLAGFMKDSHEISQQKWPSALPLPFFPGPHGGSLLCRLQQHEGNVTTYRPSYWHKITRTQTHPHAHTLDQLGVLMIGRHEKE